VGTGDIQGRIQGDISSVQGQIDAFKEYIQAGGDPYGKNRPDLPGYQPEQGFPGYQPPQVPQPPATTPPVNQAPKQGMPNRRYML
jgi:hypothetical protein